MKLGYHKIIMDIKNYFLISKSVFYDIHESIYGYPKIHFWISKNCADFWIFIIQFLDIHNSFLDIQTSVYFRTSKKPFFGYPKIMLNLGYPYLIFEYP